MSEEPADFVTILSSDMIAEIVEAYFNRAMYKKKVKVVDLQPQGSGYAFSLAFVQMKQADTKILKPNGQPNITIESDMIKDDIYGIDYSDGKGYLPDKRDNKGRFTKHETVNR